MCHRKEQKDMLLEPQCSECHWLHLNSFIFKGKSIAVSDILLCSHDLSGNKDDGSAERRFRTHV